MEKLSTSRVGCGLNILCCVAWRGRMKRKKQIHLAEHKLSKNKDDLAAVAVELKVG